jgi:hypothetical protein
VNSNILKLRQPNLDGIGAQFHRIISAYAIAQKFRVPLQYDYISEYDEQIFRANKNALFKWNSFLQELIPNFVDDMEICREVVHQNHRLLPVYLKLITAQCRKERTVHVINSPHTITNRYPSFLEKLDFSNVAQSHSYRIGSQDLIRIAIHLRRGELGLSQFKDRYLSLSYYENILSQIIPKLESRGIPYEITIPVEPGQDKLLELDDPKVRLSLKIDPNNPNLIRVSKSKFRLVYEIPSTLNTPFLMRAKWIESGDAWEDFLKFLNADIFIMSKSSLSYVAAIINKHKKVIYPDFWHPKLSSWLSSNDLIGIHGAVP